MASEDQELLGKETLAKLQEGSGAFEEALKPRVVEFKGGDLALSALPERFTENTRIMVKGTVRGREETQEVEVRTDLKEIELHTNESFWAIEAHWEETDEPTLLMNGNFFDRGGEEMVHYDTPRSEWDYKAMGKDLVGRLTPWDTYNIGRFDSVSSLQTSTIPVVPKPSK